MSNQNITRLVVGGSLSLSMGVPVGQAVIETDLSKTLRWKDGRWENTAGLMKKARQRSFMPTDVLKTNTTRRTPIFNVSKRWALPLASVIVVVVISGFGIYWMQGKSEDLLPISPLQTGAGFSTAVRSVDAPYPLPAQPAFAPDPAAGQSLDQAQANAAASTAVVPAVIPEVKPAAPPPAPVAKADKAAPTVPAASPSGQASPGPAIPKMSATATAKAETKDTKPPPAVILDADVPVAKAKPQANVVQPKTTSTTSAAGSTPGQQPKPQSAPAPSSNLVSGLVALTQDGKYALFTNVQTRLPEKFAVGEQLPSGEVVKSIDKVNGKVQTDAKEYRLE